MSTEAQAGTQQVADSTTGPDVTVETSTSSESQAFSMDSMLKDHGFEDISDALLRGEEEGSQENDTGTPDPKEPVIDEQKPDEKKPEEKPPEEKQPEEKAPEKPPKGFVPTKAVQEARTKITLQQTEINTLRAELDALKTKAPAVEPDAFKDFKELTEAEFAELTTENPADALQYMNKLNQYKDHVRNVEAEARNQRETEAALENIYTRAQNAMEDIAPGLFDESGEVMEELRTFAEGVGFTEDMFYLTNPATKIILPGESEPLVLGEQAADILKLLVTMKTKASAPLPEALDVEKIKADLRVEIETEILSKLKAGKSFKSLTALPAEQDTIPEADFSGVITEAQYAKMTPAQQERYLAGA